MTWVHRPVFRVAQVIGWIVGVLALWGAEPCRANFLSNPGFEAGLVNGSLSNVVSWGIPSYVNWPNAGEIVQDASKAHSGSCFMKMNTVGKYHQSISQNVHQSDALKSGCVYQVSGWIKTPDGADRFRSDRGRVAIQVGLLSGGGWVTFLWASFSTRELDGATGVSTNWMKFSTPPMVMLGGIEYASITCAYLSGSPADTNTAGVVYFDDISYEEVDIPVAGAIKNPGFEMLPAREYTNYSVPPLWMEYGNAFGVTTNFVRSGLSSLQIWYQENLVGQDFPVTPGTRYEVSGYVANPSSTGLILTNEAFGCLLIDYLNAAGAKIGDGCVSQHFTKNSPKDQWIPLTASGVAPSGAVTARVYCAVLKDPNYPAYASGSLFFDDLTQRVVSAEGTMSGELHNPGFEDGVTGNAFHLSGTDDLPNWTWAGGDNAGFIVSQYAQSGAQSLALTWPGNYMLQDFTADPGAKYVVSGYMFTPSGSSQFSSDGFSYGQISVAFYVDGSPNPAEGHLYITEHFTTESPADTWVYFCVTSTVPVPADPMSAVVGRVGCTIFSEDIGADSQLGGVIFFDSLSVTRLSTDTPSTYADWQVAFFGATNAALSGLEEDYDHDGFSNGSEFIAGTDPTSTQSQLQLSSALRSQTQTVVLSWPSAAGRYYRILGTASPSITGFSQVVSNLAATPPLNVYTAAPPASPYFYRIEVSTNSF